MQVEDIKKPAYKDNARTNLNLFVLLPIEKKLSILLAIYIYHCILLIAYSTANCKGGNNMRKSALSIILSYVAQTLIS